ncbi:MAG: Hsp20/alpha crystallin family protein [Candidatus Roizmanbacteria bacterium]
MVNIRLHSPLSRMMFRPVMWDEDDYDMPSLTMTEGLDVYEENDTVIVKAGVPGVPADKVDVTFEDGVLRIRARFEETEEEKNKKQVVYKMERVSNFDYTTNLPRPIDEKTIEAKVEHGVVIVTAKIAEAAKPKKISVKAG